MTPRLRCALYTRKSSEEGLDQAFNSLHAQREACEAYVTSQAGEGWKALATFYDDGGFSGGSMERPALRQLLADIAAGLVDVVVVYKIDRLTRSLTDFARIVELFDAHKVSFVSVTQAFNTTTSMGRLTLNVLLSFAQFEREVTGERIRDKIAASKAKGMWMGGTLPLGYDRPADPVTRALVVNPAEADTVRRIYAAYLELGSVHALQRWLDAQGIRSKAYVTSKGAACGGLPFSRGALFHLLRSQVYLGCIVHKGKAIPGAHAAIIDEALFAAVQARLDAQARRRAARPTRVASARLTGRIFDGDGQVMSPTFSHGARGQVYRYYVSAALQQGQRCSGDAVRRISATRLEAALADVLARLLPVASGDPLASIVRVEVYAASVQLLLPVKLLAAITPRLEPGESARRDESQRTQLRLVLPHIARRQGGSARIISASGSGGHGGAPAAQRDPVLIKALRAAHALIGHDKSGHPIIDAAPASAHARRLVRLAFLAPDLQTAILDGRQPHGLTLERLTRDAPALLWQAQMAAFG